MKKKTILWLIVAIIMALIVTACDPTGNTGGNLSLPGTWVSGEYTTEVTGTQVTFTVGSETYVPWDYNLSGTTLTITNNPDYPDYLADTLVALTIGSGSTSFTGNFEYVINGAGTLTFEKQ